MNKREQKRLARSGKPLIKLHVLGAAGGVTGSLNLIEYTQGDKTTRFLLDVGMHMENRRTDFSNRMPRGIKPGDVDFVIMSHAHIDHSGYLPKLVKDGFRGKVYCTPATADLVKILLPDSGYLQEEQARRFNKRQAKVAAESDKAQSREAPSKQPLYTQKEAEASLAYLSTIDYDTRTELVPGVAVTFTEAGHILGAAVVNLDLGTGGHKRTLCFTGNIGRRKMALLRELAPVRGADFLITESTYGNKTHLKRDRLAELARIINEGHERARVKDGRNGYGVILIPAFAVGRVQVVLDDLRQLMESGAIPELPVFLDGRMSVSATEIHRKHRDILNAETRKVFAAGKDPFATKRFAICREWKDSMALQNPASEPVIIIGSSGMANGGRIVSHLQRRLSGQNNTVVFVGYQGTGTLGQSLVRFTDNPPASVGKCPAPCPKTVYVQGKQLKVRAKIEFMSDYSGHADYEDILWWLRQFKIKPRKTLVVHGDPDSLTALRDRIQGALGWDVVVPAVRETFDIL
ncbi:MAG: MBL fold metallo-hydrolase RNA specificity domain-containing protein [Candidatus Obscuribacterales bacterium]